MRKSVFFLAAFFLGFSWTLGQAAESIEETEYYDCIVVLIDHGKGLLGVNHLDDKTRETKPLSFKADPNTVYVTNQFNQVLEFSEVAAGDRIDVYTEKGSTGQEEVTTIIDYNKFEKEE